MSQQKSESYVYVYRTEKGGRIFYEGKEMLVKPGDIYYVGSGSGQREFMQEQNPECSKIKAYFGRDVLIMVEDLPKDWAHEFSKYVSERMQKFYPLLNVCRNKAVTGSNGAADLTVLEVFQYA